VYLSLFANSVGVVVAVQLFSSSRSGYRTNYVRWSSEHCEASNATIVSFQQNNAWYLLVSASRNEEGVKIVRGVSSY
jgi:hypothetical protein